MQFIVNQSPETSRCFHKFIFEMEFESNSNQKIIKERKMKCTEYTFIASVLFFQFLPKVESVENIKTTFSDLFSRKTEMRAEENSFIWVHIKKKSENLNANKMS